MDDYPNPHGYVDASTLLTDDTVQDVDMTDVGGCQPTRAGAGDHLTVIENAFRTIMEEIQKTSGSEREQLVNQVSEFSYGVVNQVPFPISHIHQSNQEFSALISGNRSVSGTPTPPEPPSRESSLIVSKTRTGRQSTGSLRTASDYASKRKRAGRTKGPLDSTRNVHTPEDWEELTLSVSVENAIPHLTQQRATFFQALMQTHKPEGSRVHITEDMEEWQLFSTTVAAQMSNFFFEDTLGQSGKDQLLQFISSYTPPESDTAQLDHGGVQRLIKLANDESLPEEMSSFFAAMAASEGHNNDSNPLKHVEQCLRLLSVYEEYHKVAHLADSNPQEMWSHVARKVGPDRLANLQASQRRESKSRGVSSATIAKTALCAMGEIQKKTLDSNIERARPVHNIVKHLGEAFLLLLPPSSLAFLKQTGNQRVIAACELLLKICPWVRTVVSQLDTHVWKPYRNGNSQLPLDVSTLEPNGTDIVFLEQLNQAVVKFKNRPTQGAPELVAVRTPGAVLGDVE